MQSIEARKEYRNSFVCAARIFKEEGVFTFWSGAVPRLARLILSGGIVFTMYVQPFSIGIAQADECEGMRRLWMAWIGSIRNEDTFKTIWYLFIWRKIRKSTFTIFPIRSGTRISPRNKIVGQRILQFRLSITNFESFLPVVWQLASSRQILVPTTKTLSTNATQSGKLSNLSNRLYQHCDPLPPTSFTQALQTTI